MRSRAEWDARPETLKGKNMAGNTFGEILRLTTFGESHGAGLGGVLDGCPAGLPLCEKDLQAELDLRKPGSGPSATKRKEADKVKILSGIFEGQTTGTPIAFYIANEDQRSRDYGSLADVFRPGHADWSYFQKYHGIRDYRGGGRASGRETAARVAAGAIAKKILQKACGAKILAACVELGGIAIPENELDMEGALSRPYFAASAKAPELWDKAVAEARAKGDTLGGIVRVEALGAPAGLGEPVFGKLDAMLAYAMMSVGAVKGVEIGAGFSAARLRGSENNDAILPTEKDEGSAAGHGPLRARFASNNAGGILGGISTGQDIWLRAALKPIASISQSQNTIDKNGNPAKVEIGGRHDLSAIPRAVPVLAAMAALTLADALLLQSRMSIWHER